ncbi:MAG: NAD-dependent epimerase/dehydratase family protein [Bacteroidales bacterium]|nr:NAD-dependent epimerase/dehydratase family protein [Bacteroidales bacterium]
MVLLIGANTIKGIHLLLNLLQRGEQVCVINIDNSLVDSYLEYYSVERRNIVNIQVDLSCYWDVVDIDPHILNAESIDAIYYCADADIISTRNVVRLAQKTNAKLCYIGSTEAIGFAEHGQTADEQTPWQPDSHRTVHAKMKFFQEMEVWRGINEGLQAVVICAGIAIGLTSSLSDRDAQIVETMRTSKCYLEGVNGFVDARDLAEIAIAMVNNEKCNNKRIIVVGHNMKFAELQNIFADTYGVQRPQRALSSKIIKTIRNVFCRKNEVWQYCNEEHTYDAQRLQSVLKYEFRPIGDTINNIVNYIKAKRTDYE